MTSKAPLDGELDGFELENEVEGTSLHQSSTNGAGRTVLPLPGTENTDDFGADYSDPSTSPVAPEGQPCAILRDPKDRLLRRRMSWMKKVALIAALVVFATGLTLFIRSLGGGEGAGAQPALDKGTHGNEEVGLCEFVSKDGAIVETCCLRVDARSSKRSFLSAVMKKGCPGCFG